jgi:hypothetical protein
VKATQRSDVPLAPFTPLSLSLSSASLVLASTDVDCTDSRMDDAQESEREEEDGGEGEARNGDAGGSKTWASMLHRAHAVIQGRKRTVAIYLTQER